MNRKYIQPLLCGLAVTAGVIITEIGLSKSDDCINKFSELREYAQIRSNRYGLENKFYGHENVAPSKLFENNEKLLRFFVNQKNEIEKLKKNEEELISSQAIKPVYEMYQKQTESNIALGYKIMTLDWLLTACAYSYAFFKYYMKGQ